MVSFQSLHLCLVLLSIVPAVVVSTDNHDGAVVGIRAAAAAGLITEMKKSDDGAHVAGDEKPNSNKHHRSLFLFHDDDDDCPEDSFCGFLSGLAKSIFGDDDGNTDADTPTCTNVSAVTDLNWNDFMGQGPWYIHRQSDNLFVDSGDRCLRESYSDREDYEIFDANAESYMVKTSGLQVTEQACLDYNETANLEAMEAKLRVGPCWFFVSALPFVWQDYWILGYSASENYALVSIGGQPTVVTDVVVDSTTSTERALCNTFGFDTGLMIMTTSPTPDVELLDRVEGMATDMGFDTTNVVNVDQTDCWADGDFASPDILCRDLEGPLPNRMEEDENCTWVGESPGVFWKCLLYRYDCPVTCGECD